MLNGNLLFFFFVSCLIFAFSLFFLFKVFVFFLYYVSKSLYSVDTKSLSLIYPPSIFLGFCLFVFSIENFIFV